MDLELQRASDWWEKNPIYPNSILLGKGISGSQIAIALYRVPEEGRGYNAWERMRLYFCSQHSF